MHYLRGKRAVYRPFFKIINITVLQKDILFSSAAVLIYFSCFITSTPGQLIPGLDTKAKSVVLSFLSDELITISFIS